MYTCVYIYIYINRERCMDVVLWAGIIVYDTVSICVHIHMLLFLKGLSVLVYNKCSCVNTLGYLIPYDKVPNGTT